MNVIYFDMRNVEISNHIESVGNSINSFCFIWKLGGFVISFLLTK
ncbi:hypothetical protein BVRB_1g003110 [Beta vulgaris subsp. vulgaris]|nr:hypothetical protein BVRB_1g003110 [Beta vulgaris subsp. vulgaris]